MKTTEFLVFGACFLVSGSAFSAGGGSGFVGNGAGVVEQDAQYAYTSLNSVISQCLNSEALCGVSEPDTVLLRKISAIAVSNFSNPGRIVFSSEKANPGFFDTACDQQHRVAMTALDTSHPIYMNVDKFYDEQGKPAIGYPALVAILIHEIGHQTGEADHALLDVLGAKIEWQLARAQSIYQYDFPGDHAGGVSIRLINFGNPVPSADLYVEWHGSPALKISSGVRDMFRCSNPSMRLVGFGLTNGHWFLPAAVTTESESLIGFAFWADLYCLDPRGTSPVVRRENAELNLTLSSLGVIRQVQVSDRK